MFSVAYLFALVQRRPMFFLEGGGDMSHSFKNVPTFSKVMRHCPQFRNSWKNTFHA